MLSPYTQARTKDRFWTCLEEGLYIITGMLLHNTLPPEAGDDGTMPYVTSVSAGLPNGWH